VPLTAQDEEIVRSALLPDPKEAIDTTTNDLHHVHRDLYELLGRLRAAIAPLDQGPPDGVPELRFEVTFILVSR
jgi:hypothetical protein